MRERRRRKPAVTVARYALGIAGAVMGLAAQAATRTIDVVDASGTPVNGSKHLVQEDTTFPVDPSSPSFPPARVDMLSFSFHASNRPVAESTATGDGLTDNSDTASATVQNVPRGTANNLQDPKPQVPAGDGRQGSKEP